MLSPVAVSGGYPLDAVRGLLIVLTSVVVERGFRHTGFNSSDSHTLEHRLSGCGAQAKLHCSGKFLKRWEYQIILPDSSETCMWVKKQEVEPYMEQWIGSKLGKSTTRLYMVTLII